MTKNKTPREVKLCRNRKYKKNVDNLWKKYNRYRCFVEEMVHNMLFITLQTERMLGLGVVELQNTNTNNLFFMHIYNLTLVLCRDSNQDNP